MPAPHHTLLALCLAAFTATAQARDARLDQLWPEHQERLHAALPQVEAINANKEIAANDADAKAVVEELLAEPHRPLAADALTGEWKVRSLQGGPYGIYIYPWFKASITRREDGLFFEKTTGSQRRSGVLLAPQNESGDWYFVGGATVNDEPQVGYSKSRSEKARSSDSVGTVWGISDDRVLMLLDVGETGYEIYQLKRPSS
ncbi:MAG: DUF4893 domain-containing protein [Rhodanobacteraceae bacterium]|nr:DUF4893 domain-containing protein [Rhodanobacteraceae bacterium]